MTTTMETSEASTAVQSQTMASRATEAARESGVRHLVSITDLDREGMLGIFHLADAFKEVAERPIPRVPALRGKTVATLFFEASTRTRLSFEAAAKRLSADVMSFSASTSSLEKGESLRDTIETIDAMGVDAMVVRHKSSGVPSQVRAWTKASVVNGGDGQHEHPTQALLDCYTIREALLERTPAGVAGPEEVEEHRHADEHAVLHLSRDERRRQIGRLRGDLDTSVHGSWVHDEDALVEPGGPFPRQSEALVILLHRGHERRLGAFFLDAQEVDDVE